MWKNRPDEDGYYWFQSDDNGVFNDDIEVGTLSYEVHDPQVVRIQGRSMYVTGSSIVLDHILLRGRYKKVEL